MPLLGAGVFVAGFLPGTPETSGGVVPNHWISGLVGETDFKNMKGKDMAKILILCTGNSCRSQMAEGFLKSFDRSLEVYSAGTKPAEQVHPKAIAVMSELGVNLSRSQPKSVDEFLSQRFDYVITVCDQARETCPVFTGEVQQQLHIGFDDPAEATGTEEEVLSEFRRIRDEIYQELKQFYNFKIKKVSLC